MRSPFVVSVVVLCAVVGCKKKGDAAATGEGSSACSVAIGKAVDTMMAGRKKVADAQRAANGLPPQDENQLSEVATKLRGVLVTRCTEDTWSSQVVACFTNASDFASIKECEKGLTPEQNQKRQQEVMKVMMGGRMGGMGGPGGPMGRMGAGHPGAMMPPAGASGGSAGSGAAP